MAQINSVIQIIHKHFYNEAQPIQKIPHVESIFVTSRGNDATVINHIFSGWKWAGRNHKRYMLYLEHIFRSTHLQFQGKFNIYYSFYEKWGNVNGYRFFSERKTNNCNV